MNINKQINQNHECLLILKLKPAAQKVNSFFVLGAAYDPIKKL